MGGAPECCARSVPRLRVAARRGPADAVRAAAPSGSQVATNKERGHAMETSKPVVVGVDGSEDSLGALREAGRMAELMDAPLKVVTVWQWPVFAGVEKLANSAWDPKREAQKMLTESLHAVFDQTLPPRIEEEVHEGPPARVLRDLSKDARMLVVGSRGRGGFTGLLLGSVSSAVVAHATCPVLITHQTKD